MEKVDLFMATNGSKFPPEQAIAVRQHIENLDENKLNVAMSLQYKDPIISLVLSLFLGAYGVDRFIIGDVGLGVGKLLTLGGCGIWAIIDWFFIMDATRQKNMQLLMQIR